MPKDKVELLEMLNDQKIPELDEEIRDFFKRAKESGKEVIDSASWNALIDEYMDQPIGFSEPKWVIRVRLFINRNYINLEEQPAVFELPAVSYFSAFCNLDFKNQANDFKVIYQLKKVTAFLLHGQTNEDFENISWLHNQLLEYGDLSKAKKFRIDFGGHQNASFENLLQNIFSQFNIQEGNTNVKITRLMIEWERSLKTGPLVIVIKHPGSILADENEFRRLFNEFLCFMYTNLQGSAQKSSHSLIFLFIVNGSLTYSHNKDNFMWYADYKNKPESYALDAGRCQDVKIIDLGPVQQLQKRDILEWVKWSTSYAELREKTIPFVADAETLLADGNYPCQVIKKLCTALDTKFDIKWIE